MNKVLLLIDIDIEHINKEKIQMRSKSSNREGNSISSFIDSLLSPPPLSNPLKKSPSQKNINDSITDQIRVPKLSPMKPKSRSQDKALQLYSTSKSYIEQLSAENSVAVSRLSEINESGIAAPGKQVRFRDSIIRRNSHYKRQNSRRESRTPSILKRSQQIRNSVLNFVQNNHHPSQGASNLHPQASNMPDDREARANRSNEVVRRRFFAILQRFQSKYGGKLRKGMKLRSDQKYKDQLFPPIFSSVFRGGKAQQGRQQISKWIRLPQLFKDYKVRLLPEGHSNIQIYCEGVGQSLAVALNSLRHSTFTLGKYFQQQQASEFGVYLVKIFQQNVWKYVIVDDYIPVSEVAGVLQPSFLGCVQIEPNEQLEIWPFILEKAYANYYANYQSLHFGNALDFLEEITGLPAELLTYQTNEKKRANLYKRMTKLIQSPQSIFMGYSQSQNSFLAIEKAVDGSLTAQNTAQIYSFTSQHPQALFDYFDRVYVIDPLKWVHSCVSTIGINIKKNEVSRFDISIRTIKVAQSGWVSLSIRQKQKRFYQRSSLNYNYIWIRAVLLQKQFDGDCRWIDARYSNNKSINFSACLQAGQYYLILLPEWKSSHCYQLSLIVQASTAVNVAKKQHEQSQKLLQKGCCDLAQRHGKLHQINLFACSYSFIHEDIGIIIQNINNQRYNGDIKINRSINGLKAAVDLVPFNIEFYVQKNPKLPYKTQISVYIPADKAYTVILMMRGGIDLPFLKKFDFGK